MTYGGNTGTSFTMMERESLTLTATPANNDVSFVKWVKNGVDVSTENPYTFNLPDGSGNDTYTAIFVSSDDQFTMTALRDPEAGGNVTPANPTTYNGNANCQFLATPNAEWNFLGWYDENGNQLTSSTEYSITRVIQNRTLTARFSHQPFRIAYTVNPAEGGSVSVSGANGSGTYDAGTSPVLTASANANFRFTRWSGDISGTNPSYTISNISSHYDNIVANFVRTYTVTASANNGGSVSFTSSTEAHGGRYDAGSRITATATVPSGYVFDYWTIDGTDDLTATSTTYTVASLDHDMTLVANYKPVFRLRLYTSPSGVGTLTGAGSEYPQGTEVTVRVSGFDRTRYEFVNWTNSASEVVSTSEEFPYTINANADLTANFNTLTRSYAVTVQIEGDGQVLSSGSVFTGGTFTEGTTLNLTTRPGEGYQFSKWVINGTESTVASQSVTVNAATTIKAVFNATSYHIVTVATDPENDPIIQILGLNADGRYNDGERLTITAFASNNPAYNFVGWFVNEHFSTRNTTLNIASVTSNLNLRAVYEITQNAGAEDYLVYSDNTKTTVIGIREGYRDLVTSVTIPTSVTAIGAQAFANCTNLSAIEIPSSVQTIGNYAFSGCSALQEVTIPSSVASLGTHVFDNCSALRSATLPTGLTSIPEGLFFNCSALASMTIPATVETIGNSAFSGCSSIYTIDVPGSVVNVGSQAFAGMRGLRFVTLNGGTQSFGTNAFESTNNIVSTNFNGTLEQWLAISFADANAQPVSRSRNLAINGQMLTDLVIPDGTTEIKPYAFFYDTLIATITIPATVTSIGGSAFAHLNSLERIVLANLSATVDENAFQAVDKEHVTVAVPCSLYTAGMTWAGFSNIVVDGMPTLTLNQRPGGMANINVVPSCSDVAYTYTISAVPGSNYEFLSWSDGNTDNPRIITLTDNDMVLAPVWQRTNNISPAIASFYGFEGSEEPANWYSLNNGANQWFVGGATASSQLVGGSKSLYVSNNQGAANNYDPSSSPYVFTEVYLLQGVYEVRFDYKVGGESGDYLSSALIPDHGNYATLALDNTGAIVLADGLYGDDETSLLWQQNNRLVSVSTPGWYQLAFFWNADDDSEVNNPGAAIDNIFLTYQTPSSLQDRVVTVTVRSNDNTMGIATTGSGSETSHIYRYGDEITIHAAVNNDALYRFVRWSDDNTDADRTINFVDIAGTSPVFEAIFEAIPDEFTINVTLDQNAVDGSTQFGVKNGNSIERTATVPFGSTASIVLNQPQAGWAFIGWWDGTRMVSTTNPYSYTCPSSASGQSSITLVAIMKPWSDCSGDDEVNDFAPQPFNFDHFNPELDPVVVTNVEVSVENGQVVVRESAGLEVNLFDVNGRLLATQSDATQPVRFDVPASGSYMVRVGNIVTRKVVVIR
ncbi:MAG: leucine-rich repeat domain-containing protein [Bacteroidales bacterium]|nr:leucine-rich repeat domain-containing protein [Bacteroidales bacterium]